MGINEYRLKIFTIFNNAVLHSFDPSQFEYQTEEEQMDELETQIDEAIKQGYDL